MSLFEKFAADSADPAAGSKYPDGGWISASVLRYDLPIWLAAGMGRVGFLMEPLERGCAFAHDAHSGELGGSVGREWTSACFPRCSEDGGRWFLQAAGAAECEAALPLQESAPAAAEEWERKRNCVDAVGEKCDIHTGHGVAPPNCQCYVGTDGWEQSWTMQRQRSDYGRGRHNEVFVNYELSARGILGVFYLTYREAAVKAMPAYMTSPWKDQVDWSDEVRTLYSVIFATPPTHARCACHRVWQEWCIAARRTRDSLQARLGGAAYEQRASPLPLLRIDVPSDEVGDKNFAQRSAGESAGALQEAQC